MYRCSIYSFDSSIPQDGSSTNKTFLERLSQRSWDKKLRIRVTKIVAVYITSVGHVLKGETSKRNDRNETAETIETTETTETKRPKRNDRNETTETKRNDRNETTETKRPKRNDRNETYDRNGRNETAENINYRKI
jgi:hypothetical protein